MNFPDELILPSKTIFRKGSIEDLVNECLKFGKSGIIVHGISLEKFGEKDKIAKTIPSSSAIEFYCRHSGEPTVDEITDIIGFAKKANAQWIAGIGGGSALDVAKAAAGLFNGTNGPAFYQEGGTLETAGIPFIAVPTTGGTGSEATINSVIINPKTKRKLSIRDKSFIARTVILDPELLKSISKEALANSSMDAYVQAYESFISKNATWLSDNYALKAIELIDRNIIEAYKSGDDDNLSSLLLGSYLAGIAFGHSRLGVIHGIAHPLGALYGLPHGLICSVCFVPSLRINKKAMGRKYKIMSDTIGMDLTDRIQKLLGELHISSPFTGKEIIEKEKIIEETLTSGSTAANPKKITREDVEEILSDLF